jgi:hypothetical protein
MAQDPDEVITATAPLPARPTDQIRAQIEATRADMSDTIDAIQERMRPRHLIAQARETVADATAEGVTTLSRRPGATIGVAAMSLGVTWLLRRALRARAVRQTQQNRLNFGSPTHRRISRRATGFLFGAGAGACWAVWKTHT